MKSWSRRQFFWANSILHNLRFVFRLKNYFGLGVVASACRTQGLKLGQHTSDKTLS